MPVKTWYIHYHKDTPPIRKIEYLLLALHTYSPESWLWRYDISITTKPKSDTDFIRDECLMGWPLWNHSTLRFGSPTGISVHSKWAESPSFRPSKLCKQKNKKLFTLYAETQQLSCLFWGTVCSSLYPSSYLDMWCKLWFLSFCLFNTLQFNTNFSPAPLVGSSASVSSRVFYFGAQDLQYDHSKSMYSSGTMAYEKTDIILSSYCSLNIRQPSLKLNYSSESFSQAHKTLTHVPPLQWSAYFQTHVNFWQ